MVNDSILNFLKDYPGMAIKPSRSDSTVLKGAFDFTAVANNGPELTDSYELKVEFPCRFPKELPKVWELQDKIPRGEEFHINPDDTLCLGSPIRLLQKANKNPTASGFARTCIVPFLYAVSRKVKDGGDFYMGELEHGEPGIVDDYMDLFCLKSKFEVINALHLLSMKKRIANKRTCPCKCGRRLGRCKFRLKINDFRKMASRSWFKKHAKTPGGGI